LDSAERPGCLATDAKLRINGIQRVHSRTTAPHALNIAKRAFAL
jgi:hypothetical protein